MKIYMVVEIDSNQSNLMNWPIQAAGTAVQHVRDIIKSHSRDVRGAMIKINNVQLENPIDKTVPAQ